MRRNTECLVLLCTLAGTLMLGLPGLAAAQPPAVKELHVGAGYGFGYSDNIDSVSSQTTHNHGNLRITFPVTHSFGSRLAISGGSTDFDSDSHLDSIDDVSLTGNLFWRNPDKGYVGIRYSWSHAELDARTPAVGSTTNRHFVGMSGARFWGDFDAGGSITYWHSKSEFDVEVSNSITDGVSLGAGAGWYPIDALRVTARFSYGYASSGSWSSDSLNGGLGISWQPPIATIRWLSIYCSGDFGGSRSDLPGADWAERYGLSVGFNLDWPGSSSLKELLRER
jgi:hypothetical protein